MAKTVVIGIIAERYGKDSYGASIPIYGVVDENSTQFKQTQEMQNEFLAEIAEKIASERLAELWRIVELVHEKAEKRNGKAPPKPP